jgi:DNA polymerase-3 subunit delta
MPSATPSAVRAQLAAGRPAPIYLIVGDDDAEMQRLAADLSAIVEDELRAFNLERIYATDKGVNAASIVESARTLPMMSPQRVVVVLRAEKLLKPKRRGKTEDVVPDGQEDAAADGADAAASARTSDAFEAYVSAPEASTVLVLVASDVDRSRRLYKLLQKTATIVECWGLKGAKDARLDLRQVARQAEQLVRQAVAEAQQQIDPAAARLVAERAGTDITRLRGDVERLLLYASGKTRITLQDVREIVSSETAQDDWAVTSAIQRGDAVEALRQLGLGIDSGAVPWMVLGQLAWFVREKLAMSDPRRVPGAVEALLRTDLDLKSSGGDPRVLLERLVVELCGVPRSSPPRGR